MDESLSEWLAFREPADWAARAERLTERAKEALKPADTVRGLDLCTGTGSNLRYLMDRLPGRQQWLVVDRDASLLGELPARLTTWAAARGCVVHREGRVSHVRGERFSATSRPAR